MASSDSSRKKRTKKAGTRSRSTTSSTTGKASAAGNRKTVSKRGATAKSATKRKKSVEADQGAATGTELLTRDQQDLFLQLLEKGASPSGACTKLAVSTESVARTLKQDEEFRERFEQVAVMMSQNVAAALYQSAMKGSVAAQTFWLRNQPPPNWKEEDQPSGEEESLAALSDEELIELARQKGVDVPVEFTEGTGKSEADAKVED